ncbi:MAG: M20 family metallopeptidase [Synergistaceae bacterium]|nr:M20 family metallopeptidase [Synergistaceae bacterium]
MKIDYLAEAHLLKEKIVSIRRKIHEHPELGNQEFNTTALIKAILAPVGYKIERPLATGLVATLEAPHSSKNTVAFRADIDALPLVEQTNLPFASCNELMHACGHDFHTAGAIGTALILAKYKDLLPHPVKFIFQPDEEGDGGAKRLIDAHALDNVDAVFGCHLDPSLAFGVIGTAKHEMYAASGPMTLTIKGKSCHAASPTEGVNSLVAAAAAITKINEMYKTNYENKGAIISVCTLKTGEALNVIPQESTFTIILRAFGYDKIHECQKRIIDIAEKEVAKFGATLLASYIDGYPGVINNETETAFVEEIAASLFGTQNVTDVTPRFTTEDFGYYIMKKKGAFYHIGIGGNEPLHSSHFAPNEDILPLMIALGAKILFEYRVTK